MSESVFGEPASDDEWTGSHVARWPTYRPNKPRDKQPALLDAETMVCADGAITTVRSWSDIVSHALIARADIYASRLGSLPQLAGATSDARTTVGVIPTRGIVSIVSDHGSKGTVTITQSDRWQAKTPTIRFIRWLDRSLAPYVGVGHYPTPGALGLRLMTDCFCADGFKPQSRPPAACIDDLVEHAIGGRCDTPALGESFDKVYELDRRNAYAHSATLPLPMGSVARLAPLDDPEGYATWYGRVAVYVPPSTTAPFSPLLLRWADGSLHQISATGLHGDGLAHVWCWKEEADAARELGMSVIFRGGWGWRQMAPCLRGWAIHMHQLRQNAPSWGIRRAIKSATVAAIGRHAMAPRRYRLVMDSRDASPYSYPYLDKNGLTDFLVEEEQDYGARMVHWASYIWMQNRLLLYRRMVAEHERKNRILATNYDSIVLARPTSGELAPRELGGWREQMYTDVTIPHARWFVSREKVRTPGV